MALQNAKGMKGHGKIAGDFKQEELKEFARYERGKIKMQQPLEGTSRELI